MLDPDISTAAALRHLHRARQLLGPIFEAHGVQAHRVTERSEVAKTVEEARSSDQPTLIEFKVQKEEAVYPMVPAGSDLHAMIRRPNGEKAAEEEVKA